MITPSTRYPLFVRFVHWSSALLVLAAYLTGDAAEHIGPSNAGANVHILAGLALLLLFPMHVWSLRMRRASTIALPPAGGVERLAALTIHLALLSFLVVQPVLGILSLWADGDPLPIPFTQWVFPPPAGMRTGTGDTLHELHEGVGTFFYFVIGVHIVAAVWHQVVRHDGVLRRML